MRLLLIRHGQTPNNVLGALDTAAPGAGLTALGQMQAEAVPAALAGEQIAGIHVSGLVRTHLTAAPLVTATGLAPREHHGLNEIAAGDLEMHTDRQAVHTYIECAERWAGGDLAPALPGGEDGYTFRARYAEAIETIAALHPEDATVAVVSHGAAIRVYAAMVAQIGETGVEDYGLANTGMVTLSGHPASGWEVVDWINHPVGGAHLMGDIEHDVTAEPDARPLGDGG